MNLESELFAFPGSVRVRRLFSVVQVKLKNLSRAPAVVAEQIHVESQGIVVGL